MSGIQTIYVKNLAGEILRISHSGDIDEVRSMIAKMLGDGTDFRNIVVFSLDEVEVQEDEKTAPILEEDGLYGFIVQIEEQAHIVKVTREPTVCEVGTDRTYYKYEVNVWEDHSNEWLNVHLQSFAVYYDSERKMFFDEKDIEVVVYGAREEYVRLKIVESDARLYDIIYKNLQVVWYKKATLAEYGVKGWESIEEEANDFDPYLNDEVDDEYPRYSYRHRVFDPSEEY